MITPVAISFAIFAMIIAVFMVFKLKSNRLKSQMQLQDSINRSNQKIEDEKAERDRLLDALNDAFLLVDSASIIRFANSAARQLFENRTILNRPFTEVFLDRRMTKGILHCLKSGESAQDNVTLPLQISSHAIRKAAASPHG